MRNSMRGGIRDGPNRPAISSPAIFRSSFRPHLLMFPPSNVIEIDICRSWPPTHYSAQSDHLSAFRPEPRGYQKKWQTPSNTTAKESDDNMYSKWLKHVDVAFAISTMRPKNGRLTSHFPPVRPTQPDFLITDDPVLPQLSLIHRNLHYPPLYHRPMN